MSIPKDEVEVEEITHKTFHMNCIFFPSVCAIGYRDLCELKTNSTINFQQPVSFYGLFVAGKHWKSLIKHKIIVSLTPVERVDRPLRRDRSAKIVSNLILFFKTKIVSV